MSRSARLPSWSACLLLALLALPAVAAPLGNRLAGHLSPYLALHGQDPVAWQEWNPDTLARARRENKLLFVSVGYFSCHWCHVMQRESYRDPAIAALLNRHFIPVKVDRELNGALDAALLEFAERMNGLAGWPLNAFVTPEGQPVFAVLYKPPGEFKAMLDSLARHWQTNAERIRAAAREASARPAPAPPLARLDGEAVRRAGGAFLAAALAAADRLQGGFGQVSKFPQSPQLALLLELQAERPDPRLGEFLQLSLDQMARLGLRDHVHGGFFRYTVDPDWATPHFEKMLADNAQLPRVYARAAQVLARQDYLQVAHASLDFLLVVLASPGGGFQASVSALDRRGREGGAYLWEPAELRRRLSPAEYRLAERVWGLRAARPFELGYLPLERVKVSARERAALDDIYRKLRGSGRLAGVPVDGKLNAGVNGLALSALSAAGRGVPRFEAAAHRLRAFIAGQLVANGRLVKARVGHRVIPEAELDDYAYVVQGLLDYDQAYADPAARRLAERLARQAWSLFFGERGWRREARPLLATLQPEPALLDDATPSPSGVLVLASQRLASPDLVAPLAHAQGLALADLGRDPFSHASHLAALRAARPERRP
jgi:hypothetical protein